MIVSSRYKHAFDRWRDGEHKAKAAFTAPKSELARLTAANKRDPYIIRWTSSRSPGSGSRS
jgi:hypothetical protein